MPEWMKVLSTVFSGDSISTSGMPVSETKDWGWLITHAKEQVANERGMTVSNWVLPDVLEILRIHVALERITATGACWMTSMSPQHHPLHVWFNGGGPSRRFGNRRDKLASYLAEAAADWAEAQVAPK